MFSVFTSLEFFQTQSPFSRSNCRLFRDGDRAAVIRFIPADGIEQKFVHRLCGDNATVGRSMMSCGNFSMNCGDERVERFGIFAVRETITLQRAGNPGQINARLNSRKFLTALLMAGNNINA